MITKIEHIAIAVNNLEEGIEQWEKLLGVASYKTEYIQSQKVITAFFKVGDVKIELIAATDPSSTVQRFIEKRGAGLHHIAFETADLDAETKRLETLDFLMLGKEALAGAENKLIRFVQPASSTGVLVELCADRI